MTVSGKQFMEELNKEFLALHQARSVASSVPAHHWTWMGIAKKTALCAIPIVISGTIISFCYLNSLVAEPTCPMNFTSCPMNSTSRLYSKILYTNYSEQIGVHSGNVNDAVYSILNQVPVSKILTVFGAYIINLLPSKALAGFLPSSRSLCLEGGCNEIYNLPELDGAQLTDGAQLPWVPENYNSTRVPENYNSIGVKWSINKHIFYAGLSRIVDTLILFKFSDDSSLAEFSCQSSETGLSCHGKITEGSDIVRYSANETRGGVKEFLCDPTNTYCVESNHSSPSLLFKVLNALPWMNPRV